MTTMAWLHCTGPAHMRCKLVLFIGMNGYYDLCRFVKGHFVEYLIQKYQVPDYDCKDKDGRTPLLLACRYNYKKKPEARLE